MRYFALLGLIAGLTITISAQANPVSSHATDVVLIRSGETQEVTLEGVCKRITNQAPIAIGIETAPASRWPKVFDESAKKWPELFDGQIKVTACK